MDINHRFEFSERISRGVGYIEKNIIILYNRGAIGPHLVLYLGFFLPFGRYFIFAISKQDSRVYTSWERNIWICIIYLCEANESLLFETPRLVLQHTYIISVTPNLRPDPSPSQPVSEESSIYWNSLWIFIRSGWKQSIVYAVLLGTLPNVRQNSVK